MARGSAIARRAFADARVRTVSFALLFAFSALAQATAYRDAYPTRADRLALARSFGANSAVRLLYGEPRDLLSVGGYVAWRVGGSLVLFAAAWGLLAAVRAMRADEDTGRTELLLVGPVSRLQMFAAQLVAIFLGAAVLWVALFVAFVAGSMPVGGSAYLALAIVSVVPVFVGVGALASQLAPSKRFATGLASAVLLVAFIVRAVADTSEGLGWLRWASPVGWAEELRPFADPRPVALVLPVLVSIGLLAVAALLSVQRDIGRGLLPARDRAAPRLGLLGSPTQLALRTERGVLGAWVLAIGAVAFFTGVISDTVRSGITKELQRQLEKFGGANVASPSGLLGFTFSFFVVAICLFCCTQVVSIRGEEADQRLDTVLALPVKRRTWFAGRLVLAAAAAAVIALMAGILAWLGAASQGAGVALVDMLGAGANTVPAALLFLGLAALAFATAPRATASIIYGLVGVTFVWWVVGEVLEVPNWLLALSPFHDVGVVPGGSFKAAAAAVMLAIGAVATIVAVARFEQRDLIPT